MRIRWVRDGGGRLLMDGTASYAEWCKAAADKAHACDVVRVQGCG